MRAAGRLGERGGAAVVGAGSLRGGERSAAVAFSGHGNDGADGRDGDVSVHGWYRMVGRGRAGRGAVLHARTERRACLAADAGGAHGRAAGAGNVQRKILRLAATGNALSYDAKNSAGSTASASGFFASGTKFVAGALGLRAAGRTGKACAGVESGRRFDFRDDSAILFRLFAWWVIGAAAANFSAQSNGPARLGGASQSDRSGAGRSADR